MKARLITFAVVAATALLCVSAGCGRKLYAPELIATPDTILMTQSVELRLVAHARGLRKVWYTVDWDDTVMVIDTSYALGETAVLYHSWPASGEYHVRAQARAVEGAWYTSDWSDAVVVRVLDAYPAYAPVIDSVEGESYIPYTDSAIVTVHAHDPDGDRIGLRVAWGDSTETTTGPQASPGILRLAHRYARPATDTVVAVVIDVTGAESRPCSLEIQAGAAGVPKWYWQAAGEPCRILGSLLFVTDGDECSLYVDCEDENQYIGLSHTSGKTKRHLTTRFASNAFVSHPSYCAATGHLFLGSEEAAVYAATPGLYKDWYWPNVNAEESLKYVEWGAGAVKDSLYYVTHADDSIFCFYDSGPSVARRSAFTPGAGLVDAPVIDADGNVLFVTSSGDLFKMGPGLDTVIWRVRPGGTVRGPVIGADRTIYLGSDAPSFRAVGPDGDLRWSVELDGACRRPAVGRTAVFVGTAAGTAYALDPTSGAVIWSRSLGRAVLVTPLVSAAGYVYFQDTSDVVHCLRQTDGSVIWKCDCRRMLPVTGAGFSPRRRLNINYYPPNPTLASNGDVIVVGQHALYCVTGYPEGTLDTLAPWPKWQHDLHNTGYVGGGR